MLVTSPGDKAGDEAGERGRCEPPCSPKGSCGHPDGLCGGRSLARRARLSWPDERRGAGEVVVTRFDPGRGWTLEQARDLVRQGYSVGNVAQRTGLPAQMLKVAVVEDEGS